MEILIVVMLMTVVVKRGVEDVWHTARGNTPPRYAAASARKKSGAAGEYWSQLWDDVWTDASEKRAARRASSSPSPVSRPRGAATQFFAGLAQDGRRAAGRSWEKGWVRLDEKRRERATRPRPETVTVPGTVVPNMQDEDGDGPRVVPNEDGGTDLTFGDDPTDPTGVSSCPECKGTAITEDGVCLSCRDRQEQRNEQEDGIETILHSLDKWEVILPDGSTRLTNDPDLYPGYRAQPAGGWKPYINPDGTEYHPTLQEGSTMTATTTEIAGLDSAITWCDESTQQYRAEITSAEATGAYCSQLAKSYRAQVVATEAVEAAITGAGVTGPALARLTAVKEKADAAAWAMERAEAEFGTARELAETAAADCEAVAAEFRAFKPGQEFYDARPDAPGREFLTAGR